MTSPASQTDAQHPQGRPAAAAYAAQPRDADASRPAPEGFKQISLSQYRLRQRWCQQQVDARMMCGEEAHARLYPWVAIALRCGADPAAIHPDVSSALALEMSATLTETQARANLADEYCPRAEALATLATARDTAIARLTNGAPFPNEAAAIRAANNAQELAQLARATGAPPMAFQVPENTERKAA